MQAFHPWSAVILSHQIIPILVFLQMFFFLIAYMFLHFTFLFSSSYDSNQVYSGFNQLALMKRLLPIKVWKCSHFYSQKTINPSHCHYSFFRTELSGFWTSRKQRCQAHLRRGLLSTSRDQSCCRRVWWAPSRSPVSAAVWTASRWLSWSCGGWWWSRPAGRRRRPLGTRPPSPRTPATEMEEKRVRKICCG